MGATKLQRRTYGSTGYTDDEIVVDNDKRSDVVINDQTTELINLYLSRIIQPITLTAPLVIDDTTASVDAAGAPVVGNLLCLKEGEVFFQAKILTVTPTGGSGYDLVLDTPLDAAFTIAGGCSERSTNLAVDGSVTPVEFVVSPSNLNTYVEWDIVRIIGQIIDDTSMDDAKFGGITALTRGIVFRYTDGGTKNLFSVKTNGELALQMFDMQYADKAPAGLFGLRFRRTFGGQSKNGVVIRLHAEHSDTLEVIVQDDLTGLTEFQIVAQGHRTDRLE